MLLALIGCPTLRGGRRRRAGATALALLLLACGPAGATVEWAGVYTADILANTSGGLRTATRYLDNLDLTVTVESALGPDTLSGKLFVHGLYNNGTQFSPDVVGDLQVVSNIDTREAWRLFQLWYEIGGETWSVKSGLYDLNTEFDAHETGSLFLHSSHGIGADFGQTGRNGPGIFPVSALALRVETGVGPGRFRFAMLDGVPGDPGDIADNGVRLSSDDGALVVAEVDTPLGASGRVWAGSWAYSASSECAFDPGTCGESTGWYLGSEGKFTWGNSIVGWFARHGRADPDLNPFAAYTGAGLVLHGPFPGRPLDRLGVAVASAAASAPYRRALEEAGAGARSRETAWELAYRFVLGDHLVIQPDLVYVSSPAATASIGDALVVGLRIELTY